MSACSTWVSQAVSAIAKVRAADVLDAFPLGYNHASPVRATGTVLVATTATPGALRSVPGSAVAVVARELLAIEVDRDSVPRVRAIITDSVTEPPVRCAVPVAVGDLPSRAVPLGTAKS